MGAVHSLGFFVLSLCVCLPRALLARRRGGAPKVDAAAIAAAFNSLKGSSSPRVGRVLFSARQPTNPGIVASLGRRRFALSPFASTRATFPPRSLMCADAELGVINSDGLERLCTEIGVDPFEDYAVLLITYYMQCGSLEAITQEEFTRGFTAMGVSSLKDLKAALPKMREDLSSNASLFDSFYKFAFKANCSEGMRVLTGDVAAGLLRLVLGPRLPIANDFAAFIEATGVKTVTRDSWIQLHSFARTVRPDLSNYDPAAAWPVLIDDYVAFKQGKTPKGAKAPGAASGGGGGGGK